MKLSISLLAIAVKVTAADTFSHLLRGGEGVRQLSHGSHADAFIAQGACEDFAVMAGTTSTCAGGFDCVIIGGYLGVNPGTSITGNFVGDIASTEDAAECAADGLTAWKAGTALLSDSTMLSEMGGLTFTPGVYNHGSSINVALNVTLSQSEVYLDAEGDPNAVFIFQVGTTLTTCANSEIVLLNGAQPENIFWILGTALTMGADSTLVGNVLAGTSITMGTNAEIIGRAIAQAAVTCETACTVKTTGRHSDSPSTSPSVAPSSSPSVSPTSYCSVPASVSSLVPSDAPSNVPASASGLPGFSTASCPAGLTFSPIYTDGGTVLGISRYDDNTEAVSLGFDFKWLGGDTTVRRVRVSTNGQIFIEDDNSDSWYSLVPIGTYGRPRIAVVQEDLNPGQNGNIITLVKSDDSLNSIMVSWEDVSFHINNGNVNAQAELFANGAVHICFGEGNMGGIDRRGDYNSFTAGIEGGGLRDPYWTGDAVVYPLPDDEYFNDQSVTCSWPTNKCYCFTP